MLRLNLDTKPAWIDLGFDVEVEVVPITSAIIAAGMAAPEVRGLPPETDTEVRFSAMVKAVAQVAIIGWRGVGDADGKEVEPTPERIGGLMDLFQLNKAFAAAYVARGFVVAEEKKGSAPLPNGTSAGAPDIVPAATGSAPSAPTS
jgi:hypothetical protein